MLLVPLNWSMDSSDNSFRMGEASRDEAKPGWLTDDRALEELLDHLVDYRNVDLDKAIDEINSLRDLAAAHNHQVARGAFCILLAGCYRWASNPGEALRAANEAVLIFRDSKDHTRYVRALNALAMSECDLEDPEALDHLLLAIHLAEEHNLPRDLAFTYINLGYLYSRRGQTEQAIVEYQRVLSDFVEHCSKHSYVRIQNNLAGALNNLGRYDEAMPYVEEGLRNSSHAQDSSLIGHLLVNKAMVLAWRGQDREAEDLVAKAVEIYIETSHHRYLPLPASDLGAVDLHAERFNQSILWLLRAKECSSSLEGEPFLPEILKNLAKAYRGIGNLDEAYQTLDSAMVRAEKWAKHLLDQNVQLAVHRHQAEWALKDADVLREMNDKLREAKEEADTANRMKTQFLANMSHEIRTPMNGVIGLTDILLASGLNDQQLDLAHTIQSCGETLLTIIDDVLDFSKIEAGKMTIDSFEFNPRDVITGVVELMSPRAEKKGLRLSHKVASDFPETLWGDGHRIRQILLNLVGNAIKFTDAGEVLICAQLIHLEGGTAKIKLSVIDSGIGMEDDRLELIFDSFTQSDGSTSRKYGGTGLGLAICKKLVELMVGRIGVKSRLGEGSTFWFELELPRTKALSDEERAPGSKRSSVIGQPLANYKFSIVEDNPVNQMVLMRMLARMGATTECVSNGVQALRRLEDNEFDVILMDCQMPEMDGYEATRRIRRMEEGTGKHQPIIAVTAGAMEGDSQNCIGCGMDDYQSKPVNGQDLLKKILGQLNRKKAA